MIRYHRFCGRLCMLIFLIAGLACNDKSKHAIANDPTIQQIFTPEEINDLSAIITFFEQQICDMLNVESDSITDCYLHLLFNVASAQRTGVIYIPIQFEAQQQMYSQLSPAAFTEIWLRGSGVNRETGAALERMTLSYDGKFMLFLESLKADYPLLGAYHQSFSEEHAITAVMIETFLYNYHLYNISDVRIRLLVALHHLTINDMYERKNAAFQSPGQ